MKRSRLIFAFLLLAIVIGAWGPCGGGVTVAYVKVANGTTFPLGPGDSITFKSEEAPVITHIGGGYGASCEPLGLQNEYFICKAWILPDPTKTP